MSDEDVSRNPRKFLLDRGISDYQQLIEYLLDVHEIPKHHLQDILKQPLKMEFNTPYLVAMAGKNKSLIELDKMLLDEPLKTRHSGVYTITYEEFFKDVLNQIDKVVPEEDYDYSKYRLHPYRILHQLIDNENKKPTSVYNHKEIKISDESEYESENLVDTHSRWYISDGNHRLCVARLFGLKYVKVKLSLQNFLPTNMGHAGELSLEPRLFLISRKIKTYEDFVNYLITSQNIEKDHLNKILNEPMASELNKEYILYMKSKDFELLHVKKLYTGRPLFNDGEYRTATYKDFLMYILTFLEDGNKNYFDSKETEYFLKPSCLLKQLIENEFGKLSEVYNKNPVWITEDEFGDGNHRGSMSRLYGSDYILAEWR